MRLCRRRCRLILAAVCCPTFLVTAVLIFVLREDPPPRPVVTRHHKQIEYIDKRGIHVIVGHYVGNDLPWDTTPNLTKDVLDTNNYNPQPGAGEMGNPVQLGPHELPRARALFNINRFNLLVSDRISVNRSLPDVRRKQCRETKYDLRRLPSASVIIVFHNEAWSTLLRTTHSVISRSPPKLLHEIILVDDASERVFLQRPLELYVARLPVPVRVLRTGNRTGLVRARLVGAREARGDALVFLDAHCECTDGWLEPLLTRIQEDRTRVVCPVIDIIHEDTFAYVRSFELHWGAFNWDLHFRWYPLSARALASGNFRSTQPFKTPVMAGGLFAINRRYFWEVGSYDEGMTIWGGENLEMSFRVWQCGGSLEIAPCSHVGHVFRRSSPYSFPGGVGRVLNANLARAALVWMDEWALFYFLLNPGAKKIAKTQDVSDRLKLRKELRCRGFKWYLDNVWPEHFLPTEDKFFGKIRNRKSATCISHPSAKSTATNQPVGKIQLSACVFETYAKQYFVFGEDRLMADESICLDLLDPQAGTYVVMMACNGLSRQKWKYKQKRLVHAETGLCLDLPTVDHPEGLTVQPCRGVRSKSQEWLLESVEWKPPL